MIIACCVQHNYYELHGERLLVTEILGQVVDPFVGRHRGAQCLPNDGDGTKLAGENMRILYGA